MSTTFVLMLTVLKIAHSFSLNDFNPFSKNKDFSSCKCTDPNHSINSLNLPAKNFLSQKLISMVKNSIQYKICEYTENPLGYVEQKLSQTVVGQKKAMKAIMNHLSAHLRKNKNVLKETPLVLHLAGDFGVGKTLTATMLSTFLFDKHLGKDPVDQSATLLLSGSNYIPLYGKKSETSEKILKEKIRLIRNRILEQIRKCPNSLIILNDLQKMDSEVFSKLEDFFEGTAYTKKKKPVVTKKAIFILTSDLGSSDVSRGWSGVKLESEIKKRFALYTNFNQKLGSLVVHVPFMPLEKKSIKVIFKKELGNVLSCNPAYDCVSFKEEVIDFLIKKWESTPVISKMNGRAFFKYVYPTFVENELRQLKFLDRKKGFLRVLEVFVKRNPIVKKAEKIEQNGVVEDKLVVSLQYKPVASTERKNDL